MSAVTAFELPVKTPLPQITMTPKILGPFELAVRWSGLDLSNSAVTRSGSWVKSICMILVCIVICLLMFLKSLMLMMDSAKPMTLEWVISCVWGFMALHGFASALCVVSWTRSRFLPQLQTTLSTLQNQQGPSCGLTDFASLYRRIVIGAALLITTWVLSSMKDRLFEGFQANSSEPFSIGYPVNLSTMYGLDPFVYLAVGISSSLAMTVYVLVYAHVNREWATFNEDLSNTLRLHQLAVPGVLTTFSARQSELIRMVKFVSQKTEVFCSVSTAFAALASANTIYMLAGFGSETSVTMKVLSFLWMNCTMAVILITHRQPAQTQAEVNNTAQLLLADDIAQHSQDEQIWRTFRSMVDRAHHSSTKMYLLQAFAVDEHLAHKILLIVPNIGTLMVLIKKMGLV